MRRTLIALVPVLFTSPALADPPAVKRPIEFGRDVQPILKVACLSCHGPDRQRGGLRLDRKADALAGGDSGAAIIPGKGAASLLARLPAGLDPDRVMPPRGDRLTAEQFGILRTWIDQGADWPDDGSTTDDPTDWWAFRPLVRPAVPPLADEFRSAANNPIDRFILAKLQEQGLTPSPEADRRTLIRRLTFDLIGLPPTPAEIEAFVNDESPNSYEKLVDRLLASPHYGERWARHWLDVVHYGDTHGYDKDKPRPNAWPYRDYVIRSFNADKPYSRFVREQVAGDVLFPGTADGVTALGLIAAGPWDFIGHAEVSEAKTDGQIARHLDRDDMAATVMNTFVSLTVQCAQCHSHKFDKVIGHAAYYQLQAVFAALDRADRPYHTDPIAAARFAELTARKRDIEKRKAELDAAVAKAGGAELVELDKKLAAAAKPVRGRPEFGYHSAIEPKADIAKWVQVDLGHPTAIDRVIVWGAHDNYNGIGAGFGFPVRFRLELSDDPDFGPDATTIVDRTTADVPNPGTAGQTFPANGATGRYVRLTATQLAPRSDDFILAVAELEVFDEAGKNLARGAAVTARDSIQAGPRWGRTNLTDGYAPGRESSADLAGLRTERAALIARTVDAVTVADLADVTAELSRVDAGLSTVPPDGMVYAGTVHHGSGSFRGTGPDGGRPRTIRVLKRGDVTHPGPAVGPAALTLNAELPGEFDLSPGHTEGDRRAALAGWLTDPKNPLTWRSIVNRVWQYHFGRGIVATANDFGRMGERPTHPALLDWLAVEFRDNGQSLKTLHRLIVTSAAYRQSSATRPDAMAVDADNRFLWRMPRRKLDAEAIRDAALAVAGRLNRTMYGPAFRDFAIEQPAHSPHYEYLAHPLDDPKTHRRSVYRFLVRSKPQPFMTALDCADPSIQVDRRTESQSPLQALALYNNGFVLTMARHLAARVAADPDPVSAAFRLALGRPPTEDERTALTEYARGHGLANACRVVLNLNEFVFVD